MKKTLSVFSAVLCLSAAAGLARADGASTAAPAAKPELAKGALSLPKTNVGAPKSIPASEHLDGFFVEVPDHLAQMKEAPRYVQIWGSKTDRDERNRGNPRPGAPTCFMNAYPSGSTDINWSGSLNTSTTVQNYARAGYYGAPGYGNVQLVRSERVVSETDDKLAYEVTLAWVDAETQGVRLHSKQTLNMSLVRELPGKVRVWGAGSNDQMTFVVRRARHEKERFFFGPLMVTVNGVQSMSASDACPVVFSLKAQKGVAASAIVHLETLLDVQDANVDQGSGFPIPQMVSAVQPGMREAKVRPMRIGISSTWMSRDTAPVLSVSSGWAGRERTQPI
jgi:hypothetical protein